MTKKCKEVTKWAMITLHPWLPSEAEQIARARAWGMMESKLDGMDVSPFMIDDVRKVKRTTNWPKFLTERFAFIGRMTKVQPLGDHMFFATPLCVGFSENLACQTIEALWGVGMLVYVHSIGVLYQSGDDISEFLRQVGRDANAAHVRDSRGRQSKRKPKST